MIAGHDRDGYVVLSTRVRRTHLVVDTSLISNITEIPIHTCNESLSIEKVEDCDLLNVSYKSTTDRGIPTNVFLEILFLYSGL